MGAAFVALLVAIAALGQLTAPSDVVASEESTTTTEPLVAPTTTTTIDFENFTVAQIATGDRFIWYRAPLMGSFWPLELLEHDGVVYLFGTPDPPYRRSQTGGLEVWATEEGIIWRYLGEVIGPDYRVTAVSKTASGLVAMGNRQADEAPFIWRSKDAATWAASELSRETGTGPGSFIRLTAAVETDETMVVFGREEFDSMAVLSAHLPDHVAIDDGSHFGVGYSEGSGGETTIQIYGPLGLVGYSATIEELGIDAETADRLFGQAQPGQSYTWSSTAGEPWVRQEVDMELVEDAWLRPDGSIMAFGHSGFGPTLWSSLDGETWESRRSSARFGVSEVQVHGTWGDLLIGSDHQRELFWSHDGVEWQALGVADLLPARLDWGLYPVAAGRGGLAAVATTWLDNMRAGPAPVVIEKDGHVLTVDFAQGLMALGRGDGTTMTARIWDFQDRPPEWITLDFHAQEVLFRDPESEEPIVAFDFATLESAMVAALTSDPNAERALLFTPEFSLDGGVWAIHALSEAIGPDSDVAHMAVIDDRVILVTLPFTHAARDPDPPNVSIRVGVPGLADSG